MKSLSFFQFFRKEFSFDNRKLSHDDPSVFCKSQWQSSKSGGSSVWSTWAYLAYRWLVSIYLVTGIAYDFIGELRKEKCDKNSTIFHCKAKWPIYLTNWNFFILTLQALMATFLVTRHYLYPDKSGKMRSSHKIYWILNNICNGLSPLVSIMYWGVVHNPEIHYIDFTNIREHVTNAVIVLVDVLICAHPMRLMHVYQPVALGLCYSAFSGLYFAMGGTNRLGFTYIYPILDWNHTERAVLVTLATVTFELLVFFSMWCLHLVRLKVASPSESKASSSAKENV